MQRKLAAVALGIIGFSIIYSPVANAHAELVSQNPAASSVIQVAPATMELLFGEDLIALGKGNQLQVLDPNGDEVTTGDVIVEGGRLSRAIENATLPGEYYVSYRAVSIDGHVIAGESAFTIGAVIEKVSPAAPSTKDVESNTGNNIFKILFYAGGALVITALLWWIYRKYAITSV